MATKIVTKNSSTAGSAPLASDLVQGELAVNVTDKRLYTENASGTIVELGTNPSADITFQDNGKAIFGAGSDLQIYHDGSNSIIKDGGTGDLQIRAANFKLNNAEYTTTMLEAYVGGAVSLWYDNAVKLATTSTGIDVTGTATMDGLTVSGNVGIGTSSPNRDLSVAGVISAQTTANDASILLLPIASENRIYSRAGDASTTALPLTFRMGDTERMRIDSSGNVGIGTTSPNAKLSVNGITTTGTAGVVNANSGDIVLQNNRALRGDNVSGTSALKLIELSLPDNDIIIGDNAFSGSGKIRFHTSATERMRIDASGNVLVGKTATGNIATVPGCELLPSGLARMSRNNGPAGQFNRNTSDGEIVTFSKAGGTVGSIGTINGDLNIGTGVAALRFNDSSNRIEPFNVTTNANTNNTVDLGVAGAAFKDLYLSGTVVAGTGATNAATLNAYSKTVSTNLPSALRVIENTGASSYWDIGSTGGASNNLNFYANANTTPKMTLSGAGDLYLSNGVYLGGTGAANKLDDYEEGTWTPVFAFGGASVGQTYGAAIGAYTKIGNLVTVSAYLVLTVLGSSTGNATITGLPFTSGNVGSRRTAGSLGGLLAISFADVPNATINENSVTIDLLETTNAGNTTPLTNGNFANNSGLKISFSYRVA
jgi:hypothetical protein